MKRELKIKKEKLYKQITLLIKCQLLLIDTELHNIEELKIKKCVQTEINISTASPSVKCRAETFNLILITFN